MENNLLINLEYDIIEKVVHLKKETENQSIALDNGDINKLNEIIDIKQSLIEDIIKMKDEYESLSKNSSTGVKEKLFIENNKIHSILKSIQLLEESNKDKLLILMNEMKIQISGIKTAKKGFNAYFKKDMYNYSNYIDINK